MIWYDIDMQWLVSLHVKSMQLSLIFWQHFGVKHSGVARAFPGGQLAHPEGQNEEENNKSLRKNKTKLSKFGKKMRKWNSCLPGTVRLATALVKQDIVCHAIHLGTQCLVLWTLYHLHLDVCKRKCSNFMPCKSNASKLFNILVLCALELHLGAQSETNNAGNQCIIYKISCGKGSIE